MRKFYSALPRLVLVGIEATGAMLWFLRLLEELGIACQVGHPAEIRKAETRKHKHDRRDALLLMRLLEGIVFPPFGCRLASSGTCATCSASPSTGELAQPGATHTAVAGAGSRFAARAAAMEPHRATTAAQVTLAEHAAQRRNELQALQQELAQRVAALDLQLQQQAAQRPAARLLMTHPGAGSSQNSSWSVLTEEMFGGQHRSDETMKWARANGEHTPRTFQDHSLQNPHWQARTSLCQNTKAAH